MVALFDMEIGLSPYRFSMIPPGALRLRFFPSAPTLSKIILSYPDSPGLVRVADAMPQRFKA